MSLKKIPCRNNHESQNIYYVNPCSNFIKVDEKATSGLCWRCIAMQIPAPIMKSKPEKSHRPQGWQFMSRFVDKDGSVFEKGVENPKLKGKFQPTEIKEKDKVHKKTKSEKLQEVLKKRADYFKSNGNTASNKKGSPIIVTTKTGESRDKKPTKSKSVSKSKHVRRPRAKGSKPAKPTGKTRRSPR